MRRRKWLMVVGIVAGMLAAATAVAGAGQPRALGPEVRVSSGAASEVLPAAAWNATAKQYLVVWEDSRTGSSDIYGRRVSAGGSPVGADFLVVAGPGDSKQQAAAVAWNGTANEYLVVWQDWRNAPDPGDGADIYGRRISAGGTLLGPEFRISTPTGAKHESRPAVSWGKAENQYLVVWEDYRADATRSTDIYGRLISATGAAASADFRVSRVATLSAQLAPAVAWNETADEFLVVWEDHRDEADYRVYGRLVDGPTGAPMGVDLRLTGSAAENAVLPDVAWSAAAGQYLVVWEDGRNFTEDVLRIATVYGRLIGADGLPADRDHRLSIRDAIANSFGPAVAWSEASGRYLVTWIDGRNVVMDGPDPVVGNDIYARRVAPDGTPAGAELQLTSVVSGELDPAVAANGGGGSFLVVWCDLRNADTTGEDVFGRKVPG